MCDSEQLIAKIFSLLYANDTKIHAKIFCMRCFLDSQRYYDVAAYLVIILFQSFFIPVFHCQSIDLWIETASQYLHILRIWCHLVRLRELLSHFINRNYIFFLSHIILIEPLPCIPTRSTVFSLLCCSI